MDNSENTEQPVKKKEKKNNWKFFLGLLIGVSAVLIGTVFYRGYFTIKVPYAGMVTVKLPTYDLFHGNEAGKFNQDEIGRKLSEIEYYLDNEYYYTADKNGVTEGIYKGVAESLREQDKYLEYYTAKELEEELTSINGTYVGIGVMVSLDPVSGGVLVENVTPNGPAAEAGLQAGDIIIKADGVELRGLSLAEATGEHLKGEEGTTVKVTLIRDGASMEFDVLRRKLDDISVYTSVLDMDGKKYGYMYITQFLTSTVNGFTDAVDSFESQKADGVVIDLRGNPGGDMNAALDMLDYILPENDGRFTQDEEYGPYKGKTMLLSVEQKNLPTVRYFATDGHRSDLSIVILADETSASASEIFTGVMKSYGYRSAGVTTYGKGIVQSVRMLYDKSGFKYTSGEYVLPDGEKIHGIGINPDTVAEASDEMNEVGIDITDPDPVLDVQLKAALELLKGEQ